jgi:transcriptional regulator with XRE-family HTH domain
MTGKTGASRGNGQGSPIQNFGARLRAAFRARRIPKLQAIAADLGVNASAISRWQNGGPISLQKAVLLCEYLDVSADWLLLNRGSLDGHRDFEATRAETELLLLLRERGPEAAAAVLRMCEHLLS